MVYNKVIHFLDVESLTYYLHMLKFTRFIEYVFIEKTKSKEMKINQLYINTLTAFLYCSCFHYIPYIFTCLVHFCFLFVSLFGFFFLSLPQL